jgi:UDP-N-acetylglucosamine--N-acetylmuramyl-(pentapeptide) pyrophosphoryl-undecaprenol N-acetylglucosamine transferase
VREAYARAEVPGVTVTSFIDDVASAIADADVVVARSGAGAIAEITAVGRAAIYVPFPHAAGDHQARNAEALARAGAAVCLRQDIADAPRLADELRRLLTDDAARVAMANAARALGKPGAAQCVAADLLQLAGLAGPRPGSSPTPPPKAPPAPHADGTSPASPERGQNLDGTSPASPERGQDLDDERAPAASVNGAPVRRAGRQEAH